jgi:hypothetical protein
MALTYPLTHILGDKLVFQRERSYSTTIVSIGAGLLFAFGGLAIPVIALKVLVFVLGIVFAAAAFYLPSLNDRFMPESITFALPSQTVTFEMSEGLMAQIPISNLREFVIDVEKRSPSAANSAGVHYLHHHINLKRHNDACWTITTTTDAEEAKKTMHMLNGLISQPSAALPISEFGLTAKVQVENEEPIVMKWQEKMYQLIIRRDKLEYLEYKSDGTKVKSLDFNLLNFKSVQYSYSAATKNKNWTITINFDDEPREHLNLYFRDLNPVECLQVEHWLQQSIQKKLSM